MFSSKRSELFETESAARTERDHAPTPHPSALSRRETDVLRWLARGKRGAEIAGLLGISICTVRVHIRHIVKKLNASTMTHAVALAFRCGILRVDGY